VELWYLDRALADLGARRAALLERRGVLLAALRSGRRAAPSTVVGVPAPPVWPLDGVPGPGAGLGAGPGVRREERAVPVQMLLLVLGGVLTAVAGLVFTVVSWGHVGIAGRAAVLAAITALALSVYAGLRSRLPATAQTAACVGLALLLLDFYAARAAGLAGLDRVPGDVYGVVVTALLAVGAWFAGQGAGSVALRWGALLLVQCTIALAGATVDGGREGWAAVVMVGAALDLALSVALGSAGRRAPAPARAVTTAAGLWGVGSCAVALSALSAASHGGGYGPVVRAGAPLALLALLGTVAARRRELPYPVRVSAAALAGVALVAMPAGVLRVTLPQGWSVAGLALPAAALAVVAVVVLRRPAAGRAGAPHPLPVGLGASGAAMLCGAGLRVLPALMQAVGEPVHRWVHPGPAGPQTWQVAGQVPLVAALVALVLGLVASCLAGYGNDGKDPQGAAGESPGTSAGAGVDPGAPARAGQAAREWGRLVRCAAAVVVAVVAGLVPVAAGLPDGAAPATAGVGAAVGGALLVRRAGTDPWPWMCAVVAPAALALVWSLPDQATALTVWGALAALGTGLAVALGESAVTWFAHGAAGFAVLALGVEAARGGAAAGLPVHLAAFAVLAVAVVCVPVAAVTGWVCVEVSGYGLASAALLMTVPHPASAATALAVAGAAALGVALRADRRRPALLTATALLTASTWIRLAAAGVSAPEPYTVPLGAVALVLGHLHRRRFPATGSWQAYGPGLGLALLPSLGAVFVDVHWLRPLLLGLAALAVTLRGAQRRLRAPLLLGGAVLATDALHELAPAIVQSLGLLPRWVPVAAAGLLLLFVGATYERRLAESRRLRDRLRHLT
jgi:hypothetical protein